MITNNKKNFTNNLVLLLLLLLMYTGRGILARDCLSSEEREKINVVDEKLRQLQEESDTDYLSKVNTPTVEGAIFFLPRREKLEIKFRWIAPLHA